MKTAMQELIQEMKYLESYPMTSFVIKLATDLLEKEKEQIIDFANCFYDDCVTEGGSLKQSSEEYYNQTYNQEETLEEWKSKFTHHCAIKTNQKK